MMNANCGYSLADISAATGGNHAQNGFFGGDWGAWIILILIFGLFGWGGGGYGGGYGGSGGIGNSYALISDNATLERKIDGVYSGICDSTFALNNTITNGFAAAQNTMTQGFAGLNTVIGTQGYETRNAITQAQIADMQGFNNLQAAVKDCCCTTQQNLKDVNYNLATQANGINQTISNGFCQTNFNAQTNTRDIIDGQNAGTRAILERLDRLESNAKDNKIAEQAQQINALQLAASQAAQNNYIVDTLTRQIAPRPVPAFAVNPPYQYTGCGCNSGGCC